MQKTIKTKPRKRPINKKHVSRKLIREFRMHSKKTHFFTTIAVQAGVFDNGRHMMYDDVIDFMEVAFETFEFNKIIDPDDDIIMRFANDMYEAVRAIFIFNVLW